MTLIVSLACFATGLAIAGFVLYLARRQLILNASRQAEDTVFAAEEKTKQLEDDVKEKIQEFEAEAWEKFDRDTHKKVDRNQAHEERLKELEKTLKHNFQNNRELYDRKNQLVQKFQTQLGKRQQEFEALKGELKQLREQWINRMLEVTGDQREELVQKLIGKIEEEARLSSAKQQQLEEESTAALAEKYAKRLLYSVLSRFKRPYCPERGIGQVSFQNEKQMRAFTADERACLKQLELSCGVDVTVNEDNRTASVLGFDPVRRELGRLTLEKLVRSNKTNADQVAPTVAQCKKQLFKKINQDGERIARELKHKDLHPEIRSMMGALRYRYSFSQNQHFHCAEVGWLCGLLSSELGLDIQEGKRAGVLHDIGKAMDHSMEGGHAMIGADFIERHGESERVVHAVRAHHHDVTPDTPLCHLVIAADAISGARPGARRSTMDSYSQKMADLHKIGSSFEGVLGTYILSAGREVRVVVDSKHVNDLKALDLSKDIARKIEEECSYPGQIKVTVVRETQSINYAK